MIQELIKTVGAQCAAAASIIGLYFSLPHRDDLPWMSKGLIAFALIACALAAALEIWSLIRRRPKFFTKDEAIIRYMRKWVSCAGRTTIFSRDMTWAKDFQAKSALMKKAKSDELVLLVHSMNKDIEEFKLAGAEVYLYGHLGHIPRSRFTIVGFKKEGSRVAIGTRIGERHVIEEFQSGFHPIFGVTEDLVQFIMNSNAKL